MSNHDSPEELLGQSKEEYAKFLENQEVDDFAQAGELLWESLKAYIGQARTIKTDNLRTLKTTACQMGEAFDALFFHCYHFHSWYSGGGVPTDFVTEKKLYTQSIKSLEEIIGARRLDSKNQIATRTV